MIHIDMIGEEIIAAKAGKSIVQFTPIEDLAPRQPGIAKGRLTEAFFEPLPEQELSAWGTGEKTP